LFDLGEDQDFERRNGVARRVAEKESEKFFRKIQRNLGQKTLVGRNRKLKPRDLWDVVAMRVISKAALVRGRNSVLWEGGDTTKPCHWGACSSGSLKDGGGTQHERCLRKGPFIIRSRTNFRVETQGVHRLRETGGEEPTLAGRKMAACPKRRPRVSWVPRHKLFGQHGEYPACYEK